MHKEKEARMRTGFIILSRHIKKDTYYSLRMLILELNLQRNRRGDQSMKVVPSLHTISVLITDLIYPVCLIRSQKEDTSYDCDSQPTGCDPFGVKQPYYRSHLWKTPMFTL